MLLQHIPNEPEPPVYNTVFYNLLTNNKPPELETEPHGCSKAGEPETLSESNDMPSVYEPEVEAPSEPGTLSNEPPELETEPHGCAKAGEPELPSKSNDMPPVYEPEVEAPSESGTLSSAETSDEEGDGPEPEAPSKSTDMPPVYEPEVKAPLESGSLSSAETSADEENGPEELYFVAASDPRLRAEQSEA